MQKEAHERNHSVLIVWSGAFARCNAARSMSRMFVEVGVEFHEHSNAGTGPATARQQIFRPAPTTVWICRADRDKSSHFPRTFRFYPATAAVPATARTSFQPFLA